MKRLIIILVIAICAVFTTPTIAQTIVVGGQTAIGLKLTLQQYDGNKVPSYIWSTTYDTIQQVINGPKYYVVESYPLYFSHPATGNWIVWMVGLVAASPSSPIQYLTWPSYYTKISFQ